MINNVFVSVVITTNGMSGKDLMESLPPLSTYLHDHFEDYEIIVVESERCSLSTKEVSNHLQNIPCTRYIRLATELDYEDAVALGLNCAIGDYTIIFNPKRDPVDVIGSSVAEGLSGKDILIGMNSNFRTKFRHLVLRPVYYFVHRTLGLKIPFNSTPLRCLSRSALSASTRICSNSSQIYMSIHNCGYPSHRLHYRVNPSYSSPSFLSEINDLMNLLIKSSTKPLRWISAIGALGSISAFIFASYSVLSHFMRQDVAPGWSSTVVIMSFLFTILFIILIFLGEYLGRLLLQKNVNESAFVIDEIYSQIMVNKNRVNVVERSE